MAKFNIELTIFRVILLILGAILLFILWFIWAIITDPPPQFFPLDDAQAEYRITHSCPSSQGWGPPRGQEDIAYCVEYRGKQVFGDSDHGNGYYFAITVGHSKVDLEPYLNQSVTNLKGKWNSSSKQCIRNKCVSIGGPYVVLDVHDLDLVGRP
jgi:hypothetical protein